MGDYIGPPRVNPGSKIERTNGQSLRYLKTDQGPSDRQIDHGRTWSVPPRMNPGQKKETAAILRGRQKNMGLRDRPTRVLSVNLRG